MKYIILGKIFLWVGFGIFTFYLLVVNFEKNLSYTEKSNQIIVDNSIYTVYYKEPPIRDKLQIFEELKALILKEKKNIEAVTIKVIILTKYAENLKMIKFLQFKKVVDRLLHLIEKLLPFIPEIGAGKQIKKLSIVLPFVKDGLNSLDNIVEPTNDVKECFLFWSFMENEVNLKLPYNFYPFEFIHEKTEQ